MAGTSSAKTRFALLPGHDERSWCFSFPAASHTPSDACRRCAVLAPALSRRPRFDVAEHGCRQLRAFRGQHAAGPLKERAAGVMALGRRDRAAFIEHAEDKILAAR